MNCPVKIEEIYKYLDGEMNAQQAREFESLVATCPCCQEMVSAERSFDSQVRTSVPQRMAPDGLFEDIIAGLDGDQHEEIPVPESVWDRLWGGLNALPLLFRLAPLCVLLLIGVLSYKITTPQVFPVYEATVATFASTANDSPLEIETNDVTQVISAFKDKVNFTLGGPHIMHSDPQLVGGRLADVGGKPAVEFRYKLGDKRVSSYYLDMSGEKLPELPPDQVMDKGAAIFYVTEHNGHGTVMCYHKWDNTACIIVSDMPAEEVLALMMKKEMPAAA